MTYFFTRNVPAEEASGEQPVSISTKPRLKKKKKTRVPAQIVNFPEASAEVRIVLFAEI